MFTPNKLPSYFQQVMSEIVFRDIETIGVETFLDDINVNATTNFKDFLTRLREVFTCLRQWELVLMAARRRWAGLNALISAITSTATASSIWNGGSKLLKI